MANINKNIIMQAGAAVANATNKAAGLSASTPEPGSIISAIQLVNGGRTIGPDALAHFTESVRNKLLSLLVTMEPIQDFNGYDHPWPAGGGKNKIYLVPYSTDDYSPFSAVLQPTIDITNQTITMTCASNGQTVLLYKHNFEPNQYTITFNATAYSKRTIVRCFDSNGNVLTNSDVSVTGCAWNSFYQGFYVSDGVGTFTVPDTVDHFWLGIGVSNDVRDDTVTLSKVMLELGSTASSWSPYSNICPISGRTGANAYISPTPNVADATTYAADWTTPAGTVYAGSADIVTGDIKAAPYYASYNGETLVGPWVSSMDVYDPDGTPTTGAQVVDLGGTMTDYHITGQDIITLMGDNYIWSDSGDVTITE